MAIRATVSASGASSTTTHTNPGASAVLRAAPSQPPPRATGGSNEPNALGLSGAGQPEATGLSPFNAGGLGAIVGARGGVDGSSRIGGSHLGIRTDKVKQQLY